MKRQITLTLLTIGLVILFLTFGHTTIASPGDLDPTFGNGGKLIDGFLVSSGDGANGIAVQADGKIVAAGRSSGPSFSDVPDFALIRYNPDGSLDTSFGNGGKVVTPIGTSGDFASSVAIQPDGKIVAAGGSNNGSNDDFALVRYNTDGSLDTTFDSDGKVTTPIGTFDDLAYAVAIQPDGKIVAAGYSSIGSNVAFALARYNPDGTLDITFDSDGKVITPIGTSGDQAGDVVIQQDGKIVAAGTSSNGSNNDFALVRYNPDGSLDTSFDSDGKVTTPVGVSSAAADAVVLQADGKIVALGTGHNGSTTDFALVRYNQDGSLDTTFDFDGKVTTSGAGGDSADSAYAVAIQQDGKIVAAGYSYNGGSPDFAVVRFNQNGSLDTTFDFDGKVTTPIGTSLESANAVAIQPDGKIVVAGYSSNAPYSNFEDFALVRYNTNGSLDTTFDVVGKVTTDIGKLEGTLRATVIQPDGKVVATGNYVVRYNPDGSRDTTFGVTGMTAVGFETYSAAVQPDGKIVVAGGSSYTYCDWGDCYDTTYSMNLARLNPDGSADTSFGNGGSFSLQAGDYAYSVSVQPDGKIVAAGGSQLIRLSGNGSIDTPFGGGDGISELPLTAIRSSVIQPDGKIVVAGPSTPANGSDVDFVLARYNTDGSLDASFDGDGIVTTNIVSDDYAQDVAIQSDGKIVAAGCASFLYDFPCNVFALARYNTNGSLDTTFDSDGKVTTSFAGGFPEVYLNSVAIRPDGKIVAAGYSDSGANDDFALALYNVDGSLDATFGGGDGITTLDFNNSNDRAYGMALDDQARAVVVGSSDGAFALARFVLGGTTPTPTPTPRTTPSPPPFLPRTNFALASNGGVASASSEYSGFPALATNNGDRKGVDWGNGGIWNDNTREVYPDFLQIDLAGTKTIDEIDVFAVQDNFQTPSEPTLSDTFTQYGVTAFDIQYWNGSAWVTVPGGSITGNNKVWSQVTFPAVMTDKIRILINNGLQNYSRLAEVEAWGGGSSPIPDPTPTPTPAPPATITVTNTSDSGAGSLRQAIADLAVGGTINFSGDISGGTITLTSGQLVIDKSLTIQGPGQSLLSISGNSASRVFYINSGVMVTLDGITIRDGAFSYPGGGGIWNDGAVTVSDSTITGNTGFYGGGIFNGALSTLNVINSTISDNSATGGCGGGECASGGGISNEGTTTVSNSTISGNTTGPCDIICPGGGGIYSTGDLLTVTNSTISGNSTGGTGGGIWAGRFIVINSTISSNTASVGGGIFSVDAVNVVGDLVVNTIVAGNSALSGGEIGGTIESANHNLIGDVTSSGGITNGVNGNIVGVNPLLGPLQNNGGLTLTHALLTGSPSINAGNNCVLSENGCGDGNPALPFDQRSFGRVGSVDIGAFEMQATRTRRRRR